MADTMADKLANAMNSIKTIDDEESLRTINSEVVRKIKSIYRKQQITATLDFNVRDKVKIKDRYVRGKSMHLFRKVGTIIKINTKTIVVRFDNVDWTLTSTMLEKA